jgi:hypothetical protein
VSQDVWIVAPPEGTQDVTAWFGAMRSTPPPLGTADEVTERLRSTWAALGRPDDGTSASDLGLPFELGEADLAEEDGLVFAVTIGRPGGVESLVRHMNRRCGTSWRVVDIGSAEELPLVETDPFR